MNKELEKALADFDKASKAHSKSVSAERDARERFWKAQRALSNAADEARKAGTKLADIKDMPEYAERDAAEKALKDICTEQKFLHAVYIAASKNAANAAANALREAIRTTPERFSMPTHYKKFNENIESVLGGHFCRFYIEAEYSTVYIYLSCGANGHNSAWVCRKNDDGTIELKDDVTDREIVDLATIKREARKAQHIVASYRKKYEELCKSYANARSELKTAINYVMPDMDKYMMDEDLF